jgi:non-specific serine/threonine protein kinase
MKGLEYLDAETLQRAWLAIDARVRTELAASGKSLRDYLHDRNPVWRLVGRIALHLAENRRDEEYPFAFMATYASGVSAQGETRNLPLARALQEFAGTANRKRLAELLRPVRDAAERLPWVQELITSGDIYQALAWTPAEAYRLLQDVPALEDAGLAVRIPDWWQPTRPPRPQVTVRVGEHGRAALGADALLDFSVALSSAARPSRTRSSVSCCSQPRACCACAANGSR